MLNTTSRSKLALAGILVLATITRLLGIISRPIWYDEAFTILFSEKGPEAMLRGTLGFAGVGGAEPHPIGYYIIVWLWMNIFGESLFSVRMISVLAGLGIVCLVYLISRELFDARLARIAMLFAALAPFQIHYSQEIRMYSWMAMWLLLATYAYVRGAKTRAWYWWLVFAVSAALAQYMQNLAAFYLVTLAFSPILQKDWRTVRSVFAAGAGAIILYLPWLVKLPSQFEKISQSYWVTQPSSSRLFTLLLVFVTNLPLPDSWLTPALFIALMVVAIGCYQTFCTIRARAQAASGGLWILYLSFAPPLLLFLFSQWKPVYIERVLLPSGATFLIWLAWALTSTKLPRLVGNLALGLLAIASFLGIYQHVTYSGFPYGNFQALDNTLQMYAGPGDVIVHSNKLSLLPSIYYDRMLPQVYITDPPGSPEDTLAPAAQEVLGVNAKANIQSAVGNATQIFYIIYQESIDEYRTAGYATHPDLAYLTSHYDLAGEDTWNGLLLYRFSRKP